MTGRLLRAACLIVALSGPAALGTVACGKSVGNTIDDATITGRVKTAMLNDPQVAGLKIDVDTFKGVVTLSGGGEVSGRSRQGDSHRPADARRLGRQVHAADQSVEGGEPDHERLQLSNARRARVSPSWIP